MLGRTGPDGAFIVEALRAARVDVDAISTADAVSGAATSAPPVVRLSYKDVIPSYWSRSAARSAEKADRGGVAQECAVLTHGRFGTPQVEKPSLVYSGHDPMAAVSSGMKPR
jgi:hypothetical protein